MYVLFLIIDENGFFISSVYINIVIINFNIMLIVYKWIGWIYNIYMYLIY